MAEPDRPQSPFAGMADLAARTPVRVLSTVEIERMLAKHRLHLETEYHQGHRANFASADLTGRDFSGLTLRGIKMDRAVGPGRKVKMLLSSSGLHETRRWRAGGRWIRTSGSWSRDRQTVMGDGTA